MSTAALKPASESKRKIKVPVKQRSSTFADPLKYKILTDEEMSLTKTRAFAFLELKSFDGERAVLERHVQFLYDEWTAGRFLWQNVILASAVLGSDEYRINGQHTCWMRVNVPDASEPVNAKIRSMRYQVLDSEQLRALYAAFDRGAPRTSGHISKVLLMDTQAAEGIPPSYIKNLLSGFRIYFSTDYKRQVSIPELIAMVEKNYAVPFNLVGRFLTIHYGDGQFVRRQAVLGAIFAIFEKNIKAGDEFWSSVCTGLNLEKKTDPRWVLRKFLMEHGHTSAAPGIEFINPEQLYCVCINAWNHWRSGQDCTYLRVTDQRSKPKS